MIQDYALAYFDILGFQAKFEELGLPKMTEKYMSFVDVVDKINQHTAALFGPLDFKESVYWVDNGDVVPAVKIFGAYASDSVLLWSCSAWPEAREKTEEERSQLSKDPHTGWMYQTVPCDTFLRACNEMICKGLELGLPLRGSLAMGKAVLGNPEGIFIGQPLIEAARLEKGQKFIGAGCCRSFMMQTIPKRFLLDFSHHMKNGYDQYFGGAVLDWPRHWRRTRKGSVAETVAKLRDGSESASDYYDNTLAMISVSDTQQHKHESVADVSIRTAYPAFSSPGLEAHVRAVREIR
jgi:hypothetical protein